MSHDTFFFPPAATPNPQEALVGAWTATVTKEDILRVVLDFLQQHLCDNTGTFLWKVNPDGKFSIDQSELQECPKPQVTHIEDTWSVDGSRITTSKGTPDEEVYNWTVQGDALVLKRVSGTCVPCLATFTANPWERAK